MELAEVYRIVNVGWLRKNNVNFFTSKYLQDACMRAREKVHGNWKYHTFILLQNFKKNFSLHASDMNL